MSTEEEYKELSAKLRYGLELAEQRLIEETARREGTLCYGRPDGKVVRISATELLKLRQSSGNNVSQTTLISDCKPEPLCIVHLSLDCSHSCEARCA